MTEAVHVPLNDAALAALKTVFKRGSGRGRVFRSSKTGEALENARHWFDDAIFEANLKNFHWHDLRHTFASRLRMKRGSARRHCGSSWAQELDDDEALRAFGTESAA